jgi:dolichol kinase
MSFLPPFGTPAGELIRALLMAAGCLAAFALAEGMRRWGAPTEVSRKAVHVASGLAAATFPWLFAHSLTVWLIGIGFTLFLAAARRGGWLPGLHGVRRTSLGDFAIIVAVCLAFSVPAWRSAYYSAGILVLTVADSTAAVLGSALGSRRYAASTSARSVEGSAIFGLTAFVTLLAALKALTPLPWENCLALAALVALPLTAIEVLSAWGLDNLVIPLAASALLALLAPHDAAWLTERLVGQPLLLALLLLAAWRWRRLDAGMACTLYLALHGAVLAWGAWGVLAGLLPLALLWATEGWLRGRLNARDPATPAVLLWRFPTSPRRPTTPNVCPPTGQGKG